MKCIKRKIIIKEKRKQESLRQNLSYSDVTSIKGNQIQHTHMQNPTNITKEDTLKIHMCFVHAHYRNIEHPGTYEKELNII